MNARVDHNASSQRLVEGEFLFTAEDFRRVAAMLHADAGIALAEGKATLVYSRLAKRLRALGLQSFRDYCALVASAEGVDERQRMLAALTTNVTRFFREPHHFEHLAKNVLPPLLDAARRGGRVRLWSAGCSTGQEPYSMALTVLNLCPEAADLDVRILATDIDPNVVETARQGYYSLEQTDGVPQDYLRRWFEPAAGERTGERGHVAGEAMHRLVSVRELNLIGDWPMKGRFDAIFCRNVVIYFDESTQTEVWRRLIGRLNPGGRLYIGHSERVASSLTQIVQDGLTTYKLRGDAA
jgi:chemotaxis protein methyltransferase CheR